MTGLNPKFRDEPLDAPQFHSDKVKVQTMMALMFFVQLGCCDGRATARHEDLVPEQKISAVNFHDGRVADVNHLSSPNCRYVKTLCGSENSNNHSLSNYKCIHLLWSGHVYHSRSDCDGLSIRKPTKQIGRLVNNSASLIT